MKRDMELIRKILEFVEEHGDGSVEGDLSLSDVEVDIAVDNIRPGAETYSLLQINYHAWLCVDAGFVEGRVSLHPNLWTSSRLTALTWKGHEKLDELRQTLPGDGLYSV